MIFYFSGNGNTRAAAKTISTLTSDRCVFIMDAIRANDFDVTIGKGESLGFIFPVYCWAPPKVMMQFIEKLNIRFEGEKFIWFVSTYGDCAGKTEEVFRKGLSKKGLDLDACYGIQMPETYVNFGKMALDTPENVQRKYSKAKADIRVIATDILSRKKESRLTVGDMPFVNTYIVRPIFYKFLVTDRKWVVDDKCTGCGTCAKVCPFGNITVNSKPKWNGNCTTCEACYHVCPQNAIQFGKTTIGKGQFKFPSPTIFDD